MNKNDILNNVTRSFNKTGLKLKKYSPEILVITGIVGTVTSAVMACKATTKASVIIESHKEKMAEVHQAAEHASLEEYSEKDIKRDTALVYTQTAVEFIKLYGPSVALGALSITSILASTNILKKRNVALAAAYATIDSSFKDYRKRVIDRFGKEIDRELKYNIKTKEVEKTVIDEKGKEKTVKETVKVLDDDPNKYSEFARIFDDGCTGWEKDAEHNLFFLNQQQNWANEQLKSKGYLFLNEVYQMLGIPVTKAGQCVGWIYDKDNPVGDNYVDFGIYDINRPKARDFVNGYERTVVLDFNVDGPILDLL